ncbi:MAG: glycosyltransferase [Streptococcaceae bacterium]|jgi:glycosyltransferase involved in cell wall biosynthesis|nr:glycosyltransferase [Streptococcaceae bacterium]
MEPLISVIIPIYNVEAYLKECLESVLAQTYAYLEIILIDDGSTDGSKTIAEAYQAKDSRVHLIQQENLGLSGARNTGLDAAKGDYFLFVDSDDVISPRHIEDLYAAVIASDADSAQCLYTRDIVQLKDVKNPKTTLITGDYMMRVKSLAASNHSFKYAWGRLMKRSVAGRIRFEVGMILEDGPYFYETLDETSRVVLLDSPSYFYRKRPDSILNAPANPRHFDQFKKNQLLESYFEKKHPEGLDYSRAQSFSGNDALVKRYVGEDTAIARELLARLYTENHTLLEKRSHKNFWYRSTSHYALYLRLLRLVHRIKR